MFAAYGCVFPKGVLLSVLTPLLSRSTLWFQLMILKEQNSQKKTLADGVLDMNHEQESTPSTNGKAGLGAALGPPLLSGLPGLPCAQGR